MTKTSIKQSVEPPPIPKKPVAKKGFVGLFPAILAVILALAVGCVKYADVPINGDGFQSLVSKFSSFAVQDSSSDTLPDKYETDIVDIDVRHLVSDLVCDDLNFTSEVLFDGKVFHVTQPMEDEQPMGNDRVFFMLNGANNGVYASWNGQFDCIGMSAMRAAVWLGADRDVMWNGIRLYSQMGWPVRNEMDLRGTKNIVHVLLEFQLWQWPGIKKGYKYVLEDGVTLTMVGISPKVFDVEFFLTQEEADQVIELGLPKLNRSQVDGSNSSTIVSTSRTSHTSFLGDSLFTRDFQRRSARVARLPSPSYVERMQLVRYGPGEFYRQHFDTFHSREFLPKGAASYSYEDYVEWAKWAADQLRSLDLETKVPEEFREGGPLFPNADDSTVFPSALLHVFYDYMNSTNMFEALYDTDREEWIRTNLEAGADNMMKDLLDENNRPSYLPLIVRSWEEKLGRGELRYTFPKKEVNAVSHFFNWVRWAKERVQYLGDEVPSIARPTGSLYPQFTVDFQEMLMGFILDDYSKGFVSRMTNSEWYDWMVENRGRNHVLFQVMQVWPQFAELAIRTWESRVGYIPGLRYQLPTYVQHFHPQRYVTLFLYLNNQTKIGGETVFPFSLDRYSDETIVRNGMSECSTGLAVPPLGLHASLFYVQTPEGVPDDMSRHGGCPPHEGIKWGANSFMWDSDAEEGAFLWTTK